MPIRIPDSLPATATLESENIFVMTEYRALHQDIRPLKLVILNLMPTKITTETQILRKLSNTPLQIDVELLQVVSHDAKNTSEKHLESFYRTFDEIKNRRYDGMIITGAPVENLEFEDVDYWEVNEAFAAQFIGVERMLQEEHGMQMDRARTNINGSGISLGHPAGCTALRIVVSLIYEMFHSGHRVGGAALCVGGGPAMVFFL